jgi:cyclophilin family peptidyl-prolyl cis-trans isomerase
MVVSKNVCLAGTLLGLALLLACSTSLNAQNTAPTKKAAAAPAKKPMEPADPLKEFQGYLGRQQEMSKRMEELAQLAQKAEEEKDIDKLRELSAEFEKLQIDFRGVIQPKLLQLAPLALKKDPLQPTAAELTAGAAIFGESDYAAAREITARLIEAKKATPILYWMDGLASFSMQDFPRAQDSLQQALATKNPIERQQMETFGAVQMLEVIPTYIQYWKEEQEIRQREGKANDLPRVVLETTKGTIELELFENEAPNTVANFISLVKKKFYDGLLFHRVIPNFMAQVGNPGMKAGSKTPQLDPNGPGYTIADECWKENSRKHFTGSLSMAKTDARDSAGSEFFITHLPTAHLNPQRNRDGQESGFTVFGRVLKGMDVVYKITQGDTITSATVVRDRGHAYVPKVKKLARKSIGQKATDEFSEDPSEARPK